MEVRERVEAMIEDAVGKGERRGRDVERWLMDVEEFVKMATTLIEGSEGRAENRCFKGLCPDFATQYQLNREAVKKLEAVVRLREEATFVNVSHGVVQRDIWSRDFKDYESFESRMSTFEDIYYALEDGYINIVGVYGMGGIGKTTLVKQVARRAMEDRLFDEVVMASVILTLRH